MLSQLTQFHQDLQSVVAIKGEGIAGAETISIYNQFLQVIAPMPGAKNLPPPLSPGDSYKDKTLLILAGQLIACYPV